MHNLKARQLFARIKCKIIEYREQAGESKTLWNWQICMH